MESKSHLYCKKTLKSESHGYLFHHMDLSFWDKFLQIEYFKNMIIFKRNFNRNGRVMCDNRSGQLEKKRMSIKKQTIKFPSTNFQQMLSQSYDV